MDSIVVCAVFQDAASYILEWLAFHRMIGVDRFVLYDLGSTDGTAALIARSRFGRWTTVIGRPREADRAAIYADFVANYASGFSWAAILEGGDFLHPLAADSLRPLLVRYDGFSAVILSRLMFIVGGKHRPGQLLTASYVDRAPDTSPLHTAGITLLRVADILAVQGSPPAFTIAGEACDAAGNRVTPDVASSRIADVLMVNRYRRQAGQQETIPDRRMIRFVPRLRALLHNAAVEAGRAEPVASVGSPPVRVPATQVASVPMSDAKPAPATSRPPVATIASPAPEAATIHAPPAANAAGCAEPLLGIGIVTYNREQVLAETLDRVQRHTTHPRVVVAVADDGSTDGTLEMLRTRQVLTVTGRNTGVAWNKNRALFVLFVLQRCDVVILLEDDAYPSRDGWQAEWIEAARRWGHVNVAADWLRESFISGAGTLDDPIISHQLTAQCAVFSREAIIFGGYFDTRFRGYGHEHVEHSWRLMRMGYGGSEWAPDSKKPPLFRMIWGGIAHHATPSVGEAAEWQTERNRVLAQLLLGEHGHRPAFQNEDEARQLRSECGIGLPHAVV
ncbi:MAG TPA: glycosyltransferase [Acetobacteraceae bacterium]|nr:glycosyltransferase [Acetobacteraceae bacterium]